MAAFLDRLGRTVARHEAPTITVWLLIIVGVAVAAVAAGGKTQDMFAIPGARSQQATDLLAGDANWWLPRWLGRFLPEIRIEEGATPPVAVPIPQPAATSRA